MAEIIIGTVIIQSVLDEVFRRIEQTADRETRAHEAQFAWLQIQGLRKIVAAVSPDFAPYAKKDGGESEYQQVLDMLDAALKRVERLMA